MNDLTNILLGLGVLCVVLVLCAIPLVAKLLSSIKTIQQALVPGVPSAEKREVGPQPFEVRRHVPCATEDELDRVEAELKSVQDDVRKLRQEIKDNGDKRREAIEAKVKEARDEAQHNFNTLNREVGGLKTAVELNTEHLARIEEKLDRR